MAADSVPVVVDLDGGFSEFESSNMLTDPALMQLEPVLDGSKHPVVYVAVGSPGVKPLRAIRRSGAGRIRTVVVDEGIGTYGSASTRFAGIRREGSGVRATFSRTVVRLALPRLLRSQRWALFDEVRGEWAVRQEIADEFRRRNPGGERGEHVVYLSQPWPELGVVSADDYAKHLNAVGDAARAAGREFLVRRHPWETGKPQHGREVLPGDGPAELDERVRAAGLVVSESSTALLTLAAVFDTPTCRVIGPAERVRGLRLSADQRALFERFAQGPVEPAGLGRVLRSV